MRNSGTLTFSVIGMHHITPLLLSTNKTYTCHTTQVCLSWTCAGLQNKGYCSD